MVYNTGCMEDRKLRSADFERSLVSEKFRRLQHEAGLSEQGKGRVDEAMRAAVAHVEKERSLQYGMQAQHIDRALTFLDKHYEGRHDLLPKERELIERSFNSHFGVTEPESKEAE